MSDPIPPTIEWVDDHVRLIDQRQLPDELVLVDVTSVAQLCDLIRTLAVRGAPALGAAGAMGVALASVLGDDVEVAAARLRDTRPTAVNLAWGIDRALASVDPVGEAKRIAHDDVETNRRIGAAGAALIGDVASVLTHCNTGSLACVGYGTALGVVRAAHEQGRRLHVWVDETRPLLQGARLTMWELDRLGIPARLIVDSAAASRFGAGLVDLVLVGADRIAAHGDVANKVGTYGLAVLAHHHDVPFYVAAPTSTIDAACPSGSAIEIEERGGDEVSPWWPGSVGNPAFDVTPAALVTAWITEEGVSTTPPRAPEADALR
ncbi:MAG: methylthioribose-phosphate isomerase [Acidimicrobiaceae bacterium]